MRPGALGLVLSLDHAQRFKEDGLRAGGRGTGSPRPNGTICEGQVPRDPASMALDSTQSALEVKTPSVCCLHPERMASTPREDLRNRLQAGKRYHPLPGYKTCLGGPKMA